MQSNGFYILSLSGTQVNIAITNCKEKNIKKLVALKKNFKITRNKDK